jgi:hypothetical protein
MKFKNEKNAEEGEEARIISITDKAFETVALRLYVKGKPQVVIDITDGDGGACGAVSMTRDKALKFARAIVNELSPGCI